VTASVKARLLLGVLVCLNLAVFGTRELWKALA
jgi:hypothetical protein